MFKNKILKKIGAGLMAGLCAFTLIGTNIGGLKASAASTAKEPLLSGDEVIKQAAKYLGVPYGWDAASVTLDPCRGKKRLEASLNFAPFIGNYTEKVSREIAQCGHAPAVLPSTVCTAISLARTKSAR